MILVDTAHATELVSDTALNSDPTTTKGTGWTFTAGKLVASGVTGSRASIAVSVPKGTRVRYSVTVANRSAGSLQVVVGSPNMTTTGVNVPVTDGTNGLLAIPDNFTTSLGLYTGAEVQAPNTFIGINEVSAFRFFCSGQGYFGRFDPLLQQGIKGGSHGHRFIMNTGITPNTTYRSLRRSGGTTCGKNRYPVQRSGYWTPWMMNGEGAIVMPIAEQFYYKGTGRTQNTMSGAPDSTHMGYIIGLPNGLRYIKGYNMAGGGSFPAGNERSAFAFECRVNDIAPWGNRKPGTSSYTTFAGMVTAGCAAGDIMFVSMEGPACWNGTQVDTVDHRSHMKYPGEGTLGVDYFNVTATGFIGPSCPTSHPYVIPTFAWQSWYLLDASFAAGKWRLSSDDAMTTQVPGGTTLHMDYMEGWSPTWKAQWQTECLDNRRSCNNGMDGLGNSFVDPNQQLPIVLSGNSKQYAYRPLPRTGESRPLATNGTFTGELTADTGDSIYLTAGDGFTGEVLDWSMNTVTPVNVLNGTTHH